MWREMDFGVLYFYTYRIVQDRIGRGSVVSAPHGVLLTDFKLSIEITFIRITF